MPTEHYTVRRSGGYNFRLLSRPERGQLEPVQSINPSRLISRSYESYPVFDGSDTRPVLRPQPSYPWQSINYVRPPIIWVYPVPTPSFPPQIGSVGSPPVSLPHWTYPGTSVQTPVQQLPPTRPIRWCRAEGLQPHPTDCRRFVRCHFESNEGVFVYRERICPQGLAWDQEIESCNYISQVPTCQRISSVIVSGTKGGSKTRPTVISGGRIKNNRRPILVSPLPLPSVGLNDEVEQSETPERVYVYEVTNNNNDDNLQPEPSNTPSVTSTAPSFYTTESDEETTKGVGKNNASVFVLSDRHQPFPSQLVGERRKSSSSKRSSNANTSRSNLVKSSLSPSSETNNKYKPTSTNKTQSAKDQTSGVEYELHSQNLDSNKKK